MQTLIKTNIEKRKKTKSELNIIYVITSDDFA